MKNVSELNRVVNDLNRKILEMEKELELEREKNE